MSHERPSQASDEQTYQKLEARPQLIVLEGIDLSGRTTQVTLLQNWLTTQGYTITLTAWRDSEIVSEALNQVHNQSPLQPLTYSLLYCADHLDRMQYVIRPALTRGEIVLADRYTYTAFARDTARGLDFSWLHKIYSFAVQPDAVFYLHISSEEAVKRRQTLIEEKRTLFDQRKQLKNMTPISGKKGLKSGNPQPGTPQMSQEVLESFRSFEKRMYIEYEKMQKEFGFFVIEGSQSIEQVQLELRRAVMRLLLQLGT